MNITEKLQEVSIKAQSTTELLSINSDIRNSYLDGLSEDLLDDELTLRLGYSEGAYELFISNCEHCVYLNCARITIRKIMCALPTELRNFETGQQIAAFLQRCIAALESYISDMYATEKAFVRAFEV